MSKTIQCPRCGMPYDIPEDAPTDRWSCDCGEVWTLDDDGQHGLKAFTEADR